MKSEKIYDAITDIQEEFIVEAVESNLTKPRKLLRRRYLAVASVIVLLGIGGYMLADHFPHIGIGGSAGGSGHPDGSTVFMSYAGPVFPLSVPGNANDITASRDITFDFDGFGEMRTAQNGI